MSRDNILKIKWVSDCIPAVEKHLRICCFNSRLVKNKTLYLRDYVLTNHFALTETWLCSTIDKTCIGELVPTDYVMKQIPRHGRKCDGVVRINKSAILLRLITASNDGNFTHFEHMDCDLAVCGLSVRLVVIHRPHPLRIMG